MPLRRRARWVVPALLLLVCVGIVICLWMALDPVRLGLSERDYNALQVGMTPAQVLAIMGKPTKTEERKSHANTHEYWSWSRGLQYVGVEFVNGRLDQKHVDY